MIIGILALQGAFIEHARMLNRLGVASFEIRKKQDLIRPMDGLILPGGESTAMSKLLHDLDMLQTIKQMIEHGLPALGTCAGMILLAKEIEGREKSHLATMDIVVKRNAYGRQLGSFRTHGTFDRQPMEMVFIRAPYISNYGSDVKVLAIVNDKVVAASYKKQIVTAFHPELSDDLIVHKYFINLIK
ncbi:MAG: pyridoxal 5'-phosphate synthase glutaminase subunit PdxT [Acholeplasmataceae bacterium]|nr:pyridoxal 5'-phosphate synthase glutaminase subunit PdxT [Acholeplasmataceae bacterium]